MTCNVTLPLKTEEVNTLPTESPARNSERKEGESMHVCECGGKSTDIGDREYIKDTGAFR